MAASVVLLGDPRLRVVSAAVPDVAESQFVSERRTLEATLQKFRQDNGFGRAISAPQIGVNKRLIALDLGKEGGGAFCMVNPLITHRSDETFTMWDDCMSFPWLLVKVRRHKSISVEYQDEEGNTKKWENINQAVSGVLAVDRAETNRDLISRAVYDSMRDHFDAQVDYHITPTI
ncbi:polypeptide deformylase [Acanthamoeba castellanii str. Neff]|uniref:Peptide deformylase n=1 Tax=Acanthamoeba castellanii (strain ATCC 30010 / Neff) TaxID=1257118 RepID=L8H3K8_ACACF|nr:polypeptide deformylase [Acanthamoeba castellanii str. Neff]ELR19313.1 polypeptide deformylase [Acanthamoeba castellanii str. Neff]